MKGLLPRMEFRPNKKGGGTYRYHPHSALPINLGKDYDAAIRKVLDLTGRPQDAGTVAHYWRLYQDSTYWTDLTARTQSDYHDYWKHLGRVFGNAPIRLIDETAIARYLRRERASAPVRANRERSLLSNICALAIEYGEIKNNPCRGHKAGGVKRNKERARTILPIADEMPKFLAWVRERGKQWRVIAAMAEYAAKAGSRRCEFLRGTWFQIRDAEARFLRGKMRDRKEVMDVIEMTPETLAILTAIRRPGCEFLFPNRFGQPYTDDGFHTMWKKAMRAALAAKIVTRRFTFHDLRAYYVSTFKEQTGRYPAIHKSEKTTENIYDRRPEIRRKAL